MSPQLKRLLAILGCVIVLGGVFYGGVRLGREQGAPETSLNQVINQTDGEPGNVDFSTFWKTWKLLDDNYVATHSTTTVSTQDRVYGAIQGMVASLGDPYTVFFPPEENSEFQSQINADFDGVGMEMNADANNDGGLTVVTTLPDSPALKAGIMPGDEVIAIDGTSTASMSIDEAVGLIRGPKGTSVVLTMYKGTSTTPTKVTLIRDTINLPVLDSHLDPKTNIFTIKLYSFSTDSANLFRAALRTFVMSGSHKLILDLRGNPGGLLDSAVDIASWFLPPGKVVVQEDYGPGKAITYDRSVGYDIFNNNLKMVILVDQGSASAAEILAGALSEYGKATLVGTRTFGKGSVQELINIDSQSTLKVTIARWLTPEGKSISNGGLTPDVEVPLTAADIASGTDPQMAKAIEILSQ